MNLLAFIRARADFRAEAAHGSGGAAARAVAKDEKAALLHFSKAADAGREASAAVVDEGGAMKRLSLATLVLAFAGPAAHAADVGQGADLYRRHCAACHGSDGRPVLPGAPDFTRVPSLMKPDLGLLAAVRAGKGGMPAFQGQLRDREILDIVAHLRTFR